MTRSLLSTAQTEQIVDALSLRRILLRLEQQILLSGTNSSLLHSSFERDKVAQNLEHARTLLLRIQHNAATAKGQSLPRKQAQQVELTRHRDLIRRLTEKLYDMRRLDNGGSSFAAKPNETLVEAEQGADLGEDLLAKYFAPQIESMPLKSVDAREKSPHVGKDYSDLTTTSSEGIRSRNTKQVSTGLQPGEKAQSTASATELFGTSSQTSPNSFRHGDGKFSGGAGGSNGSSAERQLVHQDVTQAELTSSLVQLAAKLKESSLAFADDLAADNEALARTEGALGKNQEGLEAASKRMNVLRRMTEGRWWWQRYIMFILLAVLWLAEIALVFLGPKIRF